jgi:hypothetical protein
MVTGGVGVGGFVGVKVVVVVVVYWIQYSNLKYYYFVQHTAIGDG